MAFLVQVFEYSYVNGYLYVKRQSRLEIIRSFSTAKPANYADGTTYISITDAYIIIPNITSTLILEVYRSF
jgi:hypothetical protein